MNIEEYKKLLKKSEAKSKYNNKKVEFRGETFDSVKERDYYLLLLDREKKGEVRHINRQYKIEIQPAFIDRQGKKVQAITYLADFYYYDKIRKSWIVIDVKGFKTDVYKLKKKLLAYKGIYIEEVL